jgi:ASC-1-like (ASCH) protein
MRLHNKPFEQIRTGQKTIELRLFDEKRQSITVGDELELINRNTEDKIRVQVTELLQFSDFSTLLDNCDIARCGGESKEQVLALLREYYSEDEEKRYGVVGIGITIVLTKNCLNQDSQD